MNISAHELATIVSLLSEDDAVLGHILSYPVGSSNPYVVTNSDKLRRVVLRANVEVSSAATTVDFTQHFTRY